LEIFNPHKEEDLASSDSSDSHISDHCCSSLSSRSPAGGSCFIRCKNSINSTSVIVSFRSFSYNTLILSVCFTDSKVSISYRLKGGRGRAGPGMQLTTINTFNDFSQSPSVL